MFFQHPPSTRSILQATCLSDFRASSAEAWCRRAPGIDDIYFSPYRSQTEPWLSFTSADAESGHPEKKKRKKIVAEFCSSAWSWGQDDGKVRQGQAPLKAPAPILPFCSVWQARIWDFALASKALGK